MNFLNCPVIINSVEKVIRKPKTQKIDFQILKMIISVNTKKLLYLEKNKDYVIFSSHKINKNFIYNFF